jgi:hypothetical protein
VNKAYYGLLYILVWLGSAFMMVISHPLYLYYELRRKQGHYSKNKAGKG